MFDYETEPANPANVAIRMKILHAVNQPLATMSVKDICKNANVSRQTFYRHFESKFDVPVWFSVHCEGFYLNEVGRTIDWQTGYYHHFRLLAKERDFLQRVLRAVPIEMNPMPNRRKNTLLKTLILREVAVDDIMLFGLDTFVMIETELVMKWVRDGLQTDPLALARLITSVVPRTLYDALEFDC